MNHRITDDPGCSLVEYLKDQSRAAGGSDAACNAAIMLAGLGYFDPGEEQVDAGSLRELCDSLQDGQGGELMATMAATCQACSEMENCLMGLAIRDL